MFQKIQKDTNFPIDVDVRKRIEFALSIATEHLVLPIENEAFNYMLARLHCINGNNYVIIDGERRELPQAEQLLEKMDNPSDLVETYNMVVRDVIKEAKNFIVFMYERSCQESGVYDWVIILPRNGKYYKVGSIEGNPRDIGTYTVELSHAIMDILRQHYRTGVVLMFIYVLMKHYFKTNLVTTA